MTHDFIVLHRTGPERFRLEAAQDAGLVAFSFMTCLRHIVIADSDTISNLASQGGEVLTGEAAFQFILEVVCGLRSPLVGETEVAGQFKTAISSFSYPATPWGSHLAKAFKALLEDAKKVRDAHLKDLGSQSYGSVLRREIRGRRNVHILGAGQLVQEILPWVMKDGLRLTIHARDVAKAKKELSEKVGAEQFALISVVQLVDGLGNVDSHQASPEQNVADALVIAAPVTSEFASKWAARWSVQGLPKETFIADLRADSATDCLQGFDRVLQLGQFMSRLSENQALITERKSLALNAIAKAALERARSVEYRPFGWEDVCA